MKRAAWNNLGTFAGINGAVACLGVVAGLGWQGQVAWGWVFAAVWATAYAMRCYGEAVARESVRERLAVLERSARQPFLCSVCREPLEVVAGDGGEGWSLFCGRCHQVDCRVQLRLGRSRIGGKVR